MMWTIETQRQTGPDWPDDWVWDVEHDDAQTAKTNRSHAFEACGEEWDA